VASKLLGPHVSPRSAGGRTCESANGFGNVFLKLEWLFLDRIAGMCLSLQSALDMASLSVVLVAIEHCDFARNRLTWDGHA
jgi:hypothetical protein